MCGSSFRRTTELSRRDAAHSADAAALAAALVAKDEMHAAAIQAAAFTLTERAKAEVKAEVDRAES